MPISNVPAYVQKYRPVRAVVTAALANIGTSAPTGMVALVTGAANGSLVKRVTALPRANATLSGLMLFLAKKDSLSELTVIDAVTMSAYTDATTASPLKTVFEDVNNDDQIYLEQGDILYVGSRVALAAGIAFTGMVGDL